MRELKFRFRCRKTNKIYEWKDCINVMNLGDMFNTLNFESYQFTGLNDKNGKEIFEGDIIKDIHNQVWEIKWDISCFVGEGDGEMFHCFMIDEMKVIGNIYENPELLKTTNSGHKE